MGSIVRHIDDIIEEYGSWENYLEEKAQESKTKENNNKFVTVLPNELTSLAESSEFTTNISVGA